jgi:hypothetical protein
VLAKLKVWWLSVEERFDAGTKTVTNHRASKAPSARRCGAFLLLRIPERKVETERIRSVYSDVRSLADAGGTLESHTETQQVLPAGLKRELDGSLAPSADDAVEVSKLGWRGTQIVEQAPQRLCALHRYEGTK